MPNWAEGVLKVRGTRKDIKRFLIETLEPMLSLGEQVASHFGKEVNQPSAEIKENEWEFILKSKNGFYVKGTRRAFIDNNVEWYFNDSHLEVLTIDSFKQAWGVDVEPFIDLSKKYDLDIKIYVFERGMEFNQDIEIHKGKVIKNNDIKFNDYEWDCLFPHLGG